MSVSQPGWAAGAGPPLLDNGTSELPRTKLWTDVRCEVCDVVTVGGDDESIVTFGDTDQVCVDHVGRE